VNATVGSNLMFRRARRHAPLHPTSAGGANVNFLVNEGQERVEAAYRGNYRRLAEIKRRYDPDNVFHINQLYGQPGQELVAAAGQRACLQLAAMEQDPFPHAGQAVTGAVLAGDAGARAVIGDRNLERAGLVPDHDRDLGGPGMLQGVGESLLDDVEHREIDTGGQGIGFALDAQVYRQARGADLGRQCVKVAEV